MHHLTNNSIFQNILPVFRHTHEIAKDAHIYILVFAHTTTIISIFKQTSININIMSSQVNVETFHNS